LNADSVDIGSARAPGESSTLGIGLGLLCVRFVLVAQAWAVYIHPGKISLVRVVTSLIIAGFSGMVRAGVQNGCDRCVPAVIQGHSLTSA
jgi:hypothetical protein